MSQSRYKLILFQFPKPELDQQLTEFITDNEREEREVLV